MWIPRSVIHDSYYSSISVGHNHKLFGVLDLYLRDGQCVGVHMVTYFHQHNITLKFIQLILLYVFCQSCWSKLNAYATPDSLGKQDKIRENNGSLVNNYIVRSCRDVIRVTNIV